MKLKGIVDEDFVNYKLASMFLIFPSCTFKCDKECGKCVCQNSALANAATIDVSADEIVKRYLTNPISRALVFGGLEPFDSFEDVHELVYKFRQHMNDDIVIYTGYNKEEIQDKLDILIPFGNILVKFGRFIPDREHVYSVLLGVELASDNQYTERIC